MNLLAQVESNGAFSPQDWGTLSLVAAVLILVFCLVFVVVLWQFFGLWLQAFMSKADVSMFDLIGMRLRKVDSRTIVLSKIRAVKAGLDITTNDLETHYLAGGRVQNVISALIAADRARINLGYKTACAIDLAGRDVLDAVHTSVNPKVIDCPNPASGKPSIDAVAKDGIQLRAKARVTVRTNIERLVGGATEETIIARVGEGIVTSIGSAENYKQVLENPDVISKRVLEKGLDAGTAFEILSIDIADVDVGENVGAKLQADQAEADKRRFQAEAEKRAAMARAREAEMLALVQENRAKVVEAEAAIPLAIAEAFRNGNLGVMDYYRLRNIQADTSMRQSIGGQPEAKG
ncbi:MAG TPA: flotillin-like protein FloA [Phycisphaerae bacterium]|nr:flotillin-like protein FloA [Phycisphaerae bacterium]HOB75192.1 flotillin-like protein FloA [Phycisphaerae bacterium]HOJ54673.1 flotillin-like protein FloA [Phycisphaerae bacterium]HOL25977.1 flotillin-like protein FloA [Phycisphaerae bacterium]HPP19451.1 flotillin-like protein FloA [Phycisphaerae bacterium]